jgi:hypothetical protein
LIREVTLDSLKALDGGKAWHAFQTHIKRAALDCMDRPGDGKGRKVTLELELTPVMEADGDCVEVACTIRAASVVPKHQTKPYSFGLRRNGSLVFNEDSPTSVNQMTMLEDEESEDDQ